MDRDKFAKVIALFDSPNEGERVAALNAACRMLAAEGLRWRNLGFRISSSGPPQRANQAPPQPAQEHKPTPTYGYYGKQGFDQYPGGFGFGGQNVGDTAAMFEELFRQQAQRAQEEMARQAAERADRMRNATAARKASTRELMKALVRDYQNTMAGADLAELLRWAEKDGRGEDLDQNEELRLQALAERLLAGAVSMM